MGHCSSKIISVDDPKIVSTRIDHQLYFYHLQNKLSFKLLILGTKNSGKKTLISQLLEKEFGSSQILIKMEKEEKEESLKITVNDKPISPKKRTLSISQLSTNDIVVWNLINPENQGSELKKWIDKFDNIHAILYMINLELHYDFKKMVDSISHFEKIFKRNIFIEKPIFLILNKKDLFESLLSDNYFESFIPDLPGIDDSNKIQSVLEFIIKQYIGKLSKYKVHIFCINALDMNDITTMFNDIRKILLFRYQKDIRHSLRELERYDPIYNLRKTGLM
jgi:GTPase SAR1 family protein